MKKLFFITVVLLVALSGIAQGKGKSKAKSKQNSKSQTTVPAPTGNPVKLPELKEKPQIYHLNDSLKNTQEPESKENGKPPKKPRTNKSGNNNANVPGNSDNSNQETPNKNKNKHEAENDDDDDKNNNEKVKKNKNKNKENEHNNQDHQKPEQNKDQWEKENKNTQQNTNGKGNSKVRNNIPTQVKNAFNAEYPNAGNAVWTKQQGDWTVTFRNNIYNSTATYHSNGERVDTRTSMPSQQAPAPVLGEILKRFPQANPKDIIKIEKPKNPNLFQVIIEQGGKLKTMLFDDQGKLVEQQ